MMPPGAQGREAVRQLLTSTVFLVALSLIASLSVQAQAQTVNFRLNTTVQGRDKPSITVTPTDDLKRMEVVLTREDTGKSINLKVGSLKAGKSKSLSFKHAKGFAHYSATFDVLFVSGAKRNFSTDFDVSRCEGLKILMGPSDVDLGGGTVKMRATNQLTEAQLVVLGDNGRRLRQVEESFEPHTPGDVLEMSWDPVEEDILRVEILASDVCRATYTQRIMPFSIEIPHEEVVFDTGRHAVTPGEAPKLKKTLGHIQKALSRHGTLLALKLYIGGCTDTVGGREGNRALSQRRAKSIATWLSKNGLPRSLAVYYYGCGEDKLKKPTPDEVDEPSNRRAIYMLSSQAPTRDAWKRLYEGASVPKKR